MRTEFEYENSSDSDRDAAIMSKLIELERSGLRLGETNVPRVHEKI